MMAEAVRHRAGTSTAAHHAAAAAARQGDTQPDWLYLKTLGLDREQQVWRTSLGQHWHRVKVCDRASCTVLTRSPLCVACQSDWNAAGKPPKAEWQIANPRPQTRPTGPKGEGLLIWDFRALNRRQFREVIFALQAQIADGRRIDPANVAKGVKWLAEYGEGKPLSQLVPPADKGLYLLRRWIEVSTWALQDVEAELQRKIIRVGIIDSRYAGRTVDWTDIGQAWLRELGGKYLLHLVARGVAGNTITHAAKAVRWYSFYLRENAPKQGRKPELLTKATAIDGFARWLQKKLLISVEFARLASSDPAQLHLAGQLLPGNPSTKNPELQVLTMTPGNRRAVMQTMSAALRTQTKFLHSLGGDAATWQIDKSEIPRRSRTSLSSQGSARALPDIVFDQLTANIADLGPDGLARNAVEFILHSGRRPEDTVNIPFDCIEERRLNIEGEERAYYNLRYVDRLKDGKGGHVVDLPLFDHAAKALRRQQDFLRRTKPQWFDAAGQPLRSDLSLFPSTDLNPFGDKPVRAHHLNRCVARWMGRGEKGKLKEIKQISQLLGPNGEPFDRSLVFLYAMRHTFAQQLRNAGVPIDTIQLLMGHDSIATTQGYASPNEHDRVAAVHLLTKVRNARISRDGTVVMLPIPKRLRDHQRITRAGVACGGCAEKGNIDQHGRACQHQHECENCYFWSAEWTDLPDLRKRRRRMSVSLKRQEAQMTPAGALNDAIANATRLKLRRLEEVIDKLETEIATSEDLTDDEREMIFHTLAKWEKIDRQLMEPIGARRQLVSPDMDERMINPLALQQADVAIEVTASGADSDMMLTT